ncbi:hypothetical protein B5P43_36485 [Bacillus sp. SRB_336]|nr:hypothetical protein B5P43_36485 [Bacillus sp. SRB_336]
MKTFRAHDHTAIKPDRQFRGAQDTFLRLAATFTRFPSDETSRHHTRPAHTESAHMGSAHMGSAYTGPAPPRFTGNSQRPLLASAGAAVRHANMTGGTVGGVKSLWAMVQGDPVFMRRVNGWLAVFWLGMIPFSLWMGWLNSVIYVSALSLWALVSGHWSAWQAARVEVQQQEDAKTRAKEDLVSEVVAAILAKTNVERAADEKERPSPVSG